MDPGITLTSANDWPMIVPMCHVLKWIQNGRPSCRCGTRATVEICKFSRLDGRILRWKWILAKQIRMAMVCCMQASIKTRVSGFIRFDLLRSRTTNINFCTLPFSKDVLPAAWKTVLGYTTVIPWRKKSAKVCSRSILMGHNYRDGNL